MEMTKSDFRFQGSGFRVQEVRAGTMILFCAIGLLVAGCAAPESKEKAAPAASWPAAPDNAHAPESDLPYGKPAPDKPGYVVSPYHTG